MKYLLLLLLFPSLIFAQQSSPVNPVLSPEYSRLIHSDTTTAAPLPENLRRELTVKRLFPLNTPLRKVRVRNNALVMRAAYPKKLLLAGEYTAGIAFKTVNRLPPLQTAYVQGRSMQGAPVWQGPETNEMFSYGPLLNQLEYNGQAYPYDVNGKLVPSGTGNGRHPAGYMNSIFRTGTLFSQGFHLKTALLVNDVALHEFGIRLGQTRENTFIRYNSNNTRSLEAAAGTWIKWLHISGKYNYQEESFSNTNRGGFLNKVYQQSLLTPVSFDNGQGYTLNSGQRSYAQPADNPHFLLRNNGHYYRTYAHQGSLLLERNAWRKMKYKIRQSYSRKGENSDEGFKPGTAAFPEGLLLQREKNDRLYQLNGEATRDFGYYLKDVRTQATANYVFTDARSDIRYQPAYGENYRYQRSVQELSLQSFSSYQHWDWPGINLGVGNKIYVSNTARKSYYLLPDISLALDYPLPDGSWNIRARSAYLRNATELPISRSLAYVNLLHFSVRNAGSYVQVQEVTGYDGLLPVLQEEWTSSLELYKSSLLSFTASVFRRNTKQDLFPVEANGQLVLKNMADHRNEGIDLELKLFEDNFRNRMVATSHTLSFYAYRNKVTGVNDPYNYTPIAGFSDVHTALIEGQPLGVIVGSAWQRDAAGNQVIGPDGFPVVAKDPGIIGNPNPDFVMKLHNSVQWKRFSLLADLEWQHGGDRWNGTQAVLDYYGRSQQSATGRNITSYVFPGVQTDGRPNNIPVDFYNPKEDISKNRWVRYGISGVAEDYIERADRLRLNTVKISYQLLFRRIIQKVTLSAYVNNIMLWSPYQGTDPGQLLFDQANSTGLDFFNLPATKTYGFNASIQF
ncbi:hypothetical protein [Chitinophaga sp.]|uniref:hypothetical protein n=1 Tax=Chitinophaga sp. TaxID=1869181 RepID=UPI002CF4882D|nr:hypothetical protein [Chitinophaga sp.]HWV67526.1 hypothetical protein [Chitinophaga sp.]